jgi:hypothetical protein
MKGQRVSWQQTVLTADETVGPALEELVLIHVLGLVDSRPVFPIFFQILSNSFPKSCQPTLFQIVFNFPAFCSKTLGLRVEISDSLCNEKKIFARVQDQGCGVDQIGVWHG